MLPASILTRTIQIVGEGVSQKTKRLIDSGPLEVIVVSNEGMHWQRNYYQQDNQLRKTHIASFSWTKPASVCTIAWAFFMFSIMLDMSPRPAKGLPACTGATRHRRVGLQHTDSDYIKSRPWRRYISTTCHRTLQTVSSAARERTSYNRVLGKRGKFQ